MDGFAPRPTADLPAAAVIFFILPVLDIKDVAGVFIFAFTNLLVLDSLIQILPLFP